MAEHEPLTHEELVQLHMARGMTRAEAEDKLAAEQTHATSVTHAEIQQIQNRISGSAEGRRRPLQTRDRFGD
jgi:hypothetical protein